MGASSGERGPTGRDLSAADAAAGGYRLQDLLDLGQFQRLQDGLNALCPFPSAIIDNEGNILTATAWQDVCTKFHRANERSAAECRNSDRYILAHLSEANPAVTYRCPHGLVDNAVPIVIEGVHWANFFTGQFFLEQPDLAFFREQAARYGFDEAAYLEAVRRVPVWTRAQLNAYLRFIKELIEVIAGVGLKNLKEAEAARRLRESENQARSILAEMFEGYLVVDGQGRVRDVNEALCRMLGRSREELLALTLGELTLSGPPVVAERIAQIIRDGSAAFESTLRRKDGSAVALEVVARFLPGRELLAGFMRDVTDRKQAEEALRESQATISGILNTVPQSIFWKNREGVYLGCNEPFARAVGLSSPNQIVGKTDYDLPWPRDEADAYRADDLEVVSRNHPKRHIIEPLQQADGSRLWIDTTKVPLTRADGSPWGVLGIYDDVTERKRAEEALRERERQLAESQRIAHVGSWEHNLVIGDVVWSDELFRILGLDPAVDAADFNEFVAMVHPDDRLGLQQAIAETLRLGHPFSVDYRILRRDGATRVVHAEAELLPDACGNRVILSGTAQDVTGRREAEDRQRQSEEFIRGILNTVDEGFLVIDRDYRILSANKAYCAQVGCCEQEIPGMHCYEVSHRSDRPCFERGEECPVRDVFANGEPHGALHRHADRQGGTLYVETKAYPIKDEAGNVLSVIETINNITERHLLEQERLKSQKLESIGTLAGGIAHDFNNLLQGLFGYISLARLSLDKPERVEAMLRQAEEALYLTVNLTTQLLTFSKGGNPLKRFIRLEPVVENAVRFALSGSSISHTLEAARDLWPIEADAGQLAQVIQNIVLNADDAMGGRGAIDIRVENVTPGEARPPELPAGGRFVRVAIRDSGTGIAPGNLGKIFDPYFTTKTRGSGLGLATSYSIVRGHGGAIDVESELGRGSTFTVYLPATAGAAPAESPARTAVAPASSGKILLMDDEGLVRDVACAMVRALGHEVECVADGEAAVEVYRRATGSPEPFDVVILDLTVRGGMGGEEALSRIREIDPRVVAVVSSGYADKGVVADFRAYGFSAFLNKPYRIEALRELLDSLLGTPAGRAAGDAPPRG